jgi:hypothetical protein
MLGLFGPKKADVLDHWYSLVPDFSQSTKDFYNSVEAELKLREVPGLSVDYVDFTEGGVLSAKREYLRMTRERLVFDVCAAPFGTSFFFSCRFAQIPAEVKLWQLMALLIGVCAFVALGFKAFSDVLGLAGVFIFPFVMSAILAAVLYVMRNAIAMGLHDLDASLIRTPVIGPIYEAWFRKETYYRQDTRLMYCDTITAVVKAKVEEVTGAKGIKLIRFNEYSPLLGELYKPRYSKPEPPTNP